MILEILPDLLRGVTTTVCVLCLFPVLSRPKIRLKTYVIFAITLTIVDIIICGLLYINKNYTAVFYYTLGVYILIIIFCKNFYHDKPMQWLFSCITVLNVYAIIVIASYYLAGFFFNPIYSVTVIRLIMFLSTIMFFRKYLRPLYLEVSENWEAFLLPVVGIFAGYIYIMVSLGDIEDSMRGNVIYFCILTLVTVLSYISIIFSLKSIRQKYTLREENLKRKANEEILTREINSYEGFISAAKQNRHDIRHHNAIMLEFLSQGDIEGAKEYLKEYDDNIIGGSLIEFSKNPTANAVFRLYERRAREHGIEFVVRSEYDESFACLHTDIGIILSNIFENALEACKRSNDSDKHIYYCSKVEDECIFIEVRNSVKDKLVFENGLPLTTKIGGGTGLMSVQSMVKKHGGMFDVRQEGDEFFTRIVLPIQKQ